MTQFTPELPEKKVNVTITERELILLEKLRSVYFGKTEVFKANGKIVRVETRVSYLIEPEKEVKSDGQAKTS